MRITVFVDLCLKWNISIHVSLKQVNQLQTLAHPIISYRWVNIQCSLLSLPTRAAHLNPDSLRSCMTMCVTSNPLSKKTGVSEKKIKEDGERKGGRERGEGKLEHVLGGVPVPLCTLML